MTLECPRCWSEGRDDKSRSPGSTLLSSPWLRATEGRNEEQIACNELLTKIKPSANQGGLRSKHVASSSTGLKLQ